MTAVKFCAAILILKMEEDTQHCRHNSIKKDGIRLYYFKKDENATETQKKICVV